MAGNRPQRGRRGESLPEADEPPLSALFLLLTKRGPAAKAALTLFSLHRAIAAIVVQALAFTAGITRVLGPPG